MLIQKQVTVGNRKDGLDYWLWPCCPLFLVMVLWSYFYIGECWSWVFLSSLWVDFLFLAGLSTCLQKSVIFGVHTLKAQCGIYQRTWNSALTIRCGQWLAFLVQSFHSSWPLPSLVKTLERQYSKADYLWVAQCSPLEDVYTFGFPWSSLHRQLLD